MRLNELFYITEGYKEAESEFAQAAGGDIQDVKDLIQSYKDLVNKNQVKGSERNIDYWRKQGLPAFKEFVISKQTQPTSTEIKRKKIPGKAITLRETDEWLIVVPLDKNASCFHGKDSDWCTTKPNANHFENYFYNNEITLIYCLNKKNAGMWAIAAHTGTKEIELFDQKDNPIEPDKFKALTGLNPYAVVRLAHNKPNKETANTTRETYRIALQKLDSLENYGLLRFKSPETEKLLDITRDANFCQAYIEGIYWQTKEPVDVPQSIIEAAATEYPYVLEYVDFNNQSESFVYRMMTKYDAPLTILRSGYKPSADLIKKVLSATEDESKKSSIIYNLLDSAKSELPDDLVLSILTNPYRADKLSTAYAKNKIIPSKEVFKRIVSLYPFGLDELLKIGAKPDRDIIYAAMSSSNQPQTILYDLVINGIEVPDDIIFEVTKDNLSELHAIATILISKFVMPSTELLVKADTYKPGYLAYLLRQRDMQVPKELEQNT
jgi:hypothetical protein